MRVQEWDWRKKEIQGRCWEVLFHQMDRSESNYYYLQQIVRPAVTEKEFFTTRGTLKLGI